MAISGDGETQTFGRSSEPSLPSSDLRRRRTSSPAPAAADYSSPTSFPAFEASTVDSGEESGVETSSDADDYQRVIGDEDGEENVRPAMSTGKTDVDGGRRSEGLGVGGTVPPQFLYRASSPAHVRVKESPLSSDAIFRQVSLVLDWVSVGFRCDQVLGADSIKLGRLWSSYKGWVLVQFEITERLATFDVLAQQVAYYDQRKRLEGMVEQSLLAREKGEDASFNFSGHDFEKGVSFKQLVDFMVAPTLCYQYINPIVKNSEHPLKGNLLSALERVLKLSVPTLLNILAELLCFGDREFYKDWWNAKTVEEGVAVFISFFVSAVFHEIPLVILTNYLQNKFKSTMVGNMIFWFFFSILGQPMCVLLYYHDVMNRKVNT
ncbi:O-acyltransferase [Musa troglodytarum]|uniref:diacylglycerol O-acyltransferase n=1 Tax=Musa troglodytarum TaxID=320322 RepID=A0A9E7IBV9_9LILI|nr:O-acyltransferase [Musa troglodytarum]